MVKDVLPSVKHAYWQLVDSYIKSIVGRYRWHWWYWWYGIVTDGERYRRHRTANLNLWPPFWNFILEAVYRIASRLILLFWRCNCSCLTLLLLFGRKAELDCTEGDGTFRICRYVDLHEETAWLLVGLISFKSFCNLPLCEKLLNCLSALYATVLFLF